MSATTAVLVVACFVAGGFVGPSVESCVLAVEQWHVGEILAAQVAYLPTVRQAGINQHCYSHLMKHTFSYDVDLLTCGGQYCCASRIHKTTSAVVLFTIAS